MCHIIILPNYHCIQVDESHYHLTHISLLLYRRVTVPFYPIFIASRWASHIIRSYIHFTQLSTHVGQRVTLSFYPNIIVSRSTSHIMILPNYQWLSYDLSCVILSCYPIIIVSRSTSHIIILPNYYCLQVPHYHFTQYFTIVSRSMSHIINLTFKSS